MKTYQDELIEEQKFKFNIEPFKALQEKAYNLSIELSFMNRSTYALKEIEDNLDQLLKGEKSDLWG